MIQYLTDSRVREILDAASGKTVAVIGDVMLDRYFWGNVSRISPEAPVPVIDIEKESFHLGGAANVAKNLKTLGLNPILCGIIGNDNSGKRFIEISKNDGIDPQGLFIDNDRPTIVKTRIIGNNQHIARLDREIRNSNTFDGKNHIVDTIKKKKNLAGIIFEDYDKGCLTEDLIIQILEYANNNKIPVLVDPKRKHFFEYKKVTVFKPNRKEAANALELSVETKDEIRKAGLEILKRLDCENVLLTLGSLGMMLFESNGDISSVPTKARNVADVSGAGDTAIATIAAAIAGNAEIKEAAELANFASGVVCESPGIVAIKSDELIETVRKSQK
jgi:rfaE bifunctional protein kinase chain/domain